MTKHILLVAATEMEIRPLLDWFTGQWKTAEPGLFERGETRVECLVTGIGAVATAWRLGLRLSAAPPDLVINAGIAGALDRQLALGQVVNVVSERWGDLGVEQSDGSFSDVFQSGLADPDQLPFQGGVLRHPTATEMRFLPNVHGITVQRVHGYEPHIERFRADFPEAQVESMEGAAVFYACLWAGIPFLQIRSLSNYVEKRDRSRWQIATAVDALNKTLMEMIG